MKLLLLLTLCFSTVAANAFINKSEIIKIEKMIPHSALTFRYLSMDGQTIYKCKHTEQNEWSDWKVYCGPNQKKQFSVHLMVNKYTRTRIPHNSYEIAYWLTNRSNPRNLDLTSQTTWFHLKDASNFHEISLSQSTENDLAGLYLTIKPY